MDFSALERNNTPAKTAGELATSPPSVEYTDASSSDSSSEDDIFSERSSSSCSSCSSASTFSTAPELDRSSLTTLLTPATKASRYSHNQPTVTDLEAETFTRSLSMHLLHRRQTISSLCTIQDKFNNRGLRQKAVYDALESARGRLKGGRLEVVRVDAPERERLWEKKGREWVEGEDWGGEEFDY